MVLKLKLYFKFQLKYYQKRNYLVKKLNWKSCLINCYV